MSCKYMDQCPSADRQCRANIANYNKMEHKCIPFLVTAYENAKKELQEYKDTGLTPDQIKKIDRLNMEQEKELARYKAIGLDFGITPNSILTAQQLAKAGEDNEKEEGCDE